MKEPLEAAKLIGDKLIRDTPFAYRLDVAPRHGVFDRMHFVDFGRTFGLGRPAIAYAWTQLIAPKTMRQTIEIEHSDGCKIWLNGVEVYTSLGARALNLRRDERSFQMSRHFEMVLQPGPNVLLLKSETRGSEWRVYLQPPSAKGAVVNVTSIAGARVHPFAGAAYATSKAALAGLTREMAHDFGPLGVRVNAVAPGEIETAILSPGTEKLVEQIPMRRLGKPEEVARTIYYLCTPESSYVTGVEIEINGGQHV